ncbi:MFS transporter [Thalassotalea psychrophila]|uniref:MFS transporter n=1 Tax=Thalassotalea psychrophila TaxID=3065647 RepID=A0ABY9TYT8_9GAMM|nr:MFS transporter [Colwelliaceae bacterium SQ149]
MLRIFFQSEQWHKRYSVLSLVLVALFICYIDRVMVSVASIEMQRVFSWSDTEKGFVLSSFFIGYLVMQILGGLLSNRFGAYLVFAIAVMFWSLFTLITPLAASISFSALIVARIFLGLGEGAAFPCSYRLLNDWMKKDELSRSYGLMNMSTAIGSVFSLLITGTLIIWFGWQSVFYIFGIMGLIWAYFWFKLVPNKNQNIYQSVEDNNTIKEKRSIPYKALLIAPPVLVLYFIGMVMGTIAFALASWLPSYFVDTFELSISKAGLYSILPWLVLSFIAPLTGLVADKLLHRGMASLKIRKLVTCTGMVLIIAGFYLLTFAPSLFQALALIVMIFTGLGICVTGYVPLASELFPKHSDVIYGFVAGIGSLASIFIISLTGKMLDQSNSYDGLFNLLALATACTFFIFAIFAKNKPIAINK